MTSYNFSTQIFSLGLVLTAATQLRLAHLPLGIGETLLFTWSIYIFSRILLSGKVKINGMSLSFALFWVFSIALISIGLINRCFYGEFEITTIHSIFGLGFCAIISLLFLFQENHFKNTEKCLKFIFQFGFLISVPLFFYSFYNGKIFGVQLWYYQQRFCGLSVNPNQLALLLAPLPFLGFYFLKKEKRKLFKWIYIFQIFGVLLVGVFTKSESLFIGWILGCISWYFFVKNKQVFRIGRSLKERIFKFFTSPIIVGLFFVTFFIAGFYLIETIIFNIYEEGQQGNVRFMLWKNALGVISDSLLIGFGPGAYSGIQQPFQNWEAHNTILDWGIATGILGIVLIIALFAWILFINFIGFNGEWLACCVCLISFGLFHNIYRQPIFWCILLIVSLDSFKPNLNRNCL